MGNYTETGQEKKLYGRRQGRALSIYRRNLLATYLPRSLLKLDQIDVNMERKDFLYALEAQNCHDIVLDIGSGYGESLVQRAIMNPQTLFVGCEPFLNGLAHIVDLMVQNDLYTSPYRAQIRLYNGDVREVIYRLPKGLLRRVDVFYPDPWPKRRHRSRRLLSAAFLSSLYRILEPRGELRCVTDCDAYAAFVLNNILTYQDFSWLAHGPKDWRDPFPDWYTTRYEKKAQLRHAASSYLLFMRDEPCTKR